MVGNLEHKHKELDQLLCDVIESYQTPEKFFTYSHALIQACRNLTFAVQSNKQQIPDFDTWYKPWQDAMKADPYMKWLQAKRTEVVHEDIIASKSYALLATLPDYSKIWVKEYFDYKTSTHQLIEKAREITVKNPGLSHSVIQIERRYLVDVNKKPTELVHVLAHVFCFLSILLEDLEIYLKGEEGYEGPPLELGEDVEKMLNLDESYRFLEFKVKSGDIIDSRTVQIERDEKIIKLAVKRYGQTNLDKIPGMKPGDAARTLFKAAKIMLKKDGSYLSMVFIHTAEGYYPTAVTFHDRAEKILFSYQLAIKVKELKGDAAIFIAESWLVDMNKGQKRIDSGKEVSGMRNKREALTLMMLCKDEQTLGIITEFKRQNNKITLGDDIFSNPEPSTMGILLPIHKIWHPDNQKP